MPSWRLRRSRPDLPSPVARQHRARTTGALFGILAAAGALFLTAHGPLWLVLAAMLGAAVIVGGFAFGVVMVGLRGHGLGASLSGGLAAGVAFAGAWTAGEPVLSVVIAAGFAGIGAFVSALIFLSAVGRGRVVRGAKKAHSIENRPE